MFRTTCFSGSPSMIPFRFASQTRQMSAFGLYAVSTRFASGTLSTQRHVEIQSPFSPMNFAPQRKPVRRGVPS